MKIITALKSRTNLTTLFILALNSNQYLSPFLTPELIILINTVLTALAVYFRINPRQEF